MKQVNLTAEIVLTDDLLFESLGLPIFFIGDNKPSLLLSQFNSFLSSLIISQYLCSNLFGGKQIIAFLYYGV